MIESTSRAGRGVKVRFALKAFRVFGASAGPMSRGNDVSAIVLRRATVGSFVGATSIPEPEPTCGCGLEPSLQLRITMTRTLATTPMTPKPMDTRHLTFATLLQN